MIIFCLPQSERGQMIVSNKRQFEVRHCNFILNKIDFYVGSRLRLDYQELGDGWKIIELKLIENKSKSKNRI